MNIEEYKKRALKRLNPTIANKDRESMNYACMGLFEETGEIISELRKPLYKGNFHEKQLDKNKIMKECGDFIWYLTFVCYNNNIEISENLNSTNIGLKSREELIQKSIQIGTKTSDVIKEYLEVYNNKKDPTDLKESIESQFSNINELLSGLEINFEDTLKANLDKIESRYDEAGNSKNKIEDYEK